VTVVLREIERIEERALAALRFLDAASGLPVATNLQLSAADAQVSRNRSGLFVVRSWRPLAAHREAFLTPPAAPAVGSLSLTIVVEDPGGLYLARSVNVALPRDPSPQNIATADSLFRPIEVDLYRTPAAPLGANWAALRVSLTSQSDGDALGGALLRVRAGNRVLARGLTDLRGEALVPVVGIPITTWAEDADAVTATEIDATLEVFFDPAGGSRRAAATLDVGAASRIALAPDPAALEASPAGAVSSTAIRLAAGRSQHLSLTLDLPG
jgi:hypothetical protein